MLVSIAVYAALPSFLSFDGEVPEGMVRVVYGIAAAIAAVSFLVPKVLRKSSEQSAEPANVEQAARIIPMVLSETVAVLGFVLFVRGAGTTALWPLCVAATVLMVLHFPRAIASDATSHDLARADVKIG